MCLTVYWSGRITSWSLVCSLPRNFVPICYTFPISSVYAKYQFCHLTFGKKEIRVFPIMLNYSFNVIRISKNMPITVCQSLMLDLEIPYVKATVQNPKIFHLQSQSNFLLVDLSINWQIVSARINLFGGPRSNICYWASVTSKLLVYTVH